MSVEMSVLKSFITPIINPFKLLKYMGKANVNRPPDKERLQIMYKDYSSKEFN